MQRVWIVSRSFLPKVGGAERQLLYCISSIREDFEVYVLTAQHNAINEPDLGAKVFSFRGNSLESTYATILKTLHARAEKNDILYLIFLERAAMQEQFDIVRYAKLTGLKVLIRFSSYGDATLGQNSVDFTELRKYVDYFICLGPHIFEELRDLGCSTEQLLFFRNPVCLNKFKPKTEICSSRRKEIRFVVLSRPAKKKRWDLILEAWSKIQEDFPQSTLTFICCTSKNRWYVRHLEEMQIYAKKVGALRVSFIEKYGLNDVSAALSCYSVMISASENEGMQNALLEALACGLILVARSDASTEFLPERLGLVFKHDGTPDSLSKAMIATTTVFEQKKQHAEEIRRFLAKKHAIANYYKLFHSI